MPLLSPALAALALATAPPVAPALPAAAAAPPAAIPGAEVVAGANDADRRLTVAVFIGTQGPFRFFVDTGAQNTVLADDLVDRLGITPAEPRAVTGVAGTMQVATVSLADIRIGRRSFGERFVPLLRGDIIRADGILGIDALQGQRVLFDFAHNLLTIGGAAAAQEGYDIVVTARRRKGQLIVTHARIDGVDTDVVIDTGTEVSIGNLALLRLLTRHSVTQPTRLLSVTGQAIDAEIATTGTLSVDRLKLANMEIAFADSPAFAALHLDHRPALLLGMREMRAMRRVAIDFAQRQVMFDIAG